MQTIWIQLAASASIIVFLGAYATEANAKHPSPNSEIQMLLLFTFAEENFLPFLSDSENITIDWFMKPNGKLPINTEEGSPHARVQQFIELKTALAKEGHLGPKDVYIDKSPWLNPVAAIATAILTVAIAPIYCYHRENIWEEDRNIKAFPIIHSDERGVVLLQEIFVSIALLFEMVLIGYFLDGWIRICTLALLAPGFCFALYKLARIVFWQAKWKAFWEDIFLQGLSKASNINNHDLYNRTLNEYQAVNSTPTLPLTGLQKWTVIAFSAAQLIVGLKLRLP